MRTCGCGKPCRPRGKECAGCEKRRNRIPDKQQRQAMLQTLCNILELNEPQLIQFWDWLITQKKIPSSATLRTTAGIKSLCMSELGKQILEREAERQRKRGPKSREEELAEFKAREHIAELTADWVADEAERQKKLTAAAQAFVMPVAGLAQATEAILKHCEFMEQLSGKLSKGIGA